MPTIQDIMAKKKALTKEIQDFGKRALTDEFRKVFDRFPNLKAIQWRQYTPYFNDGEPCEFSVHDFEMKLADTPEDEEGDFGDEGFETTSDYGKRGKLNKAEKAAVKRLKTEIDDEIFLVCFGDHTKVVATREGFEVEEYEHE